MQVHLPAYDTKLSAGKASVPGIIFQMLMDMTKGFLKNILIWYKNMVGNFINNISSYIYLNYCTFYTYFFFLLRDSGVPIILLLGTYYFWNVKTRGNFIPINLLSDLLSWSRIFSFFFAYFGYSVYYET